MTHHGYLGSEISCSVSITSFRRSKSATSSLASCSSWTSLMNLPILTWSLTFLHSCFTRSFFYSGVIFLKGILLLLEKKADALLKKPSPFGSANLVSLGSSLRKLRLVFCVFCRIFFFYFSMRSSAVTVVLHKQPQQYLNLSLVFSARLLGALMTLRISEMARGLLTTAS